MACDIETLLNDACAGELDGVSDGDLNLLIVAALLPGAGNPTADAVLADGACYDGYSDRQLDILILSEMCALFG